jgi:UDP-N-acetylglucosamine 4-epimerase
VTGGAGFIGSHLVESLLRGGRSVTVLDDFSSGSRANLVGFPGDLRIVEGSIQSESDCRSAMEGVGSVSHQAAFGSVPRSIEHPELYSKNNVHGTVVVLQEARRAGIRRVVLASSSSVYGDDPSLPKLERNTGDPLSPYAASKRACELFAQSFATGMGMTTICLRYFNVFGPRQNPNGPYAAVIPLFIKAALEQRQALIHGDGGQARDFTHVDNVVQANRKALTAAVPAGCHILNIACGASTDVNGLFELVRIACDSRLDAIHGPDRAGDIRDSLADIGKAKSLLGYDPEVTLEQGISRTVSWYRMESEVTP